MYEIPPLPPEDKPLLSRSGTFLKKHHDIVSIIINGVMALLAIFALLVAWESASSANKSADAANRTIAISQDSANKQLRAYVGIGNFSVAPPLISGTANGRILMQIKNYGLTPAHEIITSIHYALVEIPIGSTFGNIPTDFNYNKPISKKQLSVGDGSSTFLEPGQDTAFEAYISQEQVTMFSDDNLKTHTLYIFGEIDYFDIYNVKHARDFCAAYNPLSSGSANMVIAGSHNDERDIK